VEREETRFNDYWQSLQKDPKPAETRNSCRFDTPTLKKTTGRPFYAPTGLRRFGGRAPYWLAATPRLVASRNPLTAEKQLSQFYSHEWQRAFVRES
jgi:hypothetical protein